MHKFVYHFGSGAAEGSTKLKDLLGGKGANLAEMSNLGLPVPDGFTISTEACLKYFENNKKLSDELVAQTAGALEALEVKIGKKFGDKENPLLVSVRSGAKFSMPGMMDTILNVGLNDRTVVALAQNTKNERYAFDCYRRLIQMYGDVVLGIEKSHFEEEIHYVKKSKGLIYDQDLSTEDFKNLVGKFKEIISIQGKEFPQDVQSQLWNAICVVFESWMNDRAKIYRKIHSIPENLGTAVNIQAMVFGNFGDTSGTGVCFSRNPANGNNEFYGEFLINAQGEDVVAGIRTPLQITVEGKKRVYQNEPALEEWMPNIFHELHHHVKNLEAHFKDVQDVEFTIENSKLWILQTRNAKRTAQAAVRSLLDFHREGKLTKIEALKKLDANFIDSLLHPSLDLSNKTQPISKGLPASPGAASGIAVFSSEKAEKLKGQNIILIREETSPEDIAGMHQSSGIITARGGMTSHAAVVARGMGKPCIVGASEIVFAADKASIQIGENQIFEGDFITIDGGTGSIFIGKIPTKPSDSLPDLNTIFSWCNEIDRKLGVFANADNPHDAKVALDFGAEGIGLCRTEHMFFEKDRIGFMRQMIFADSINERKAALDKLFEFQKQDFKGIFEVMKGLPVTVRLLDPPLHEFLPHTKKEIDDLCKFLGKDSFWVETRMSKLEEFNPMLGHRGVRLAVSYPEIYEMQVRAILSAALEVQGSVPEIMVPLIQDESEIIFAKNLIQKTAAEIFEKSKKKIEFKIGTMIELPRACINAANIAAHVNFFSFGTNDLTQTTMGISRDDAGKFLDEYQKLGLLAKDPFKTIDKNGVGELIKIAIKEGLIVNPRLKIGVCGEHGGDVESIEFFASIGLNYVSCSPYRLPTAKLKVAQLSV